MSVKFFDIKKIDKPKITEFHRILDEFIASGHYVQGNMLKTFEMEYAQYCNTSHCCGVSNGLDAIYLSLKAIDIGPGDEVIVPSNTYIATWIAVLNTGATVVPVEPNPKTFIIETSAVLEKISSKTRAIIPVHLYGQCVDTKALRHQIRNAEIAIIDDAAQAHGAHREDQALGEYSDMVCWSFYPGKNLGCLGDGGAITTNNSSLDHKLRILRNYGSQEKYHNSYISGNHRLDELQAGFLRVKLKYLNSENKKRQENAKQYLNKIKNPKVTLPDYSFLAGHVWHQFVIKTECRDRLAQALNEHHVQTLIHYPIPPHRQNALKHTKYEALSLPIAEQLATTINKTEL